MKKQEKDEISPLVEDEKFKPVWKYDFIKSKRGYVDVIDIDTGEFIFRDDTSALAKEYIRQHQF